MKLYDFPGPPSPRRVRIFIAEKGLDIEKISVNIREGEHFSEDFKKINPHCTIPVLELDDGTTISSIDAINRYLEEIQPEPPLFGKNAKERAVINEWNHYINVNGFMAVAEALADRDRETAIVNRGDGSVHAVAAALIEENAEQTGL